MDYKKKYEEALERAKIELSADTTQGTKNVLMTVFPELKESDDERIRKDCISIINAWAEACRLEGDYCEVAPICIAWLEKQGDQKPVVVDFKAKDWCVSKVDGQIHNMTYNPANKVEPKFKVGDWVVTDKNDRVQIKAVNNSYYTIDNGMYFNIPYVDKCWHLWTVQDAIDGDVLAGKIDGDNYILIFKTIKDGWIETYGHYYNAVNRFCVPSQLFCRSYQGTFTPATKEQRDLLFQKMKEARYTFDFEKKELKKIEDEIEIPFGAKDSELIEESYYIPKGFHAEIEDDKVVIKKGEKLTAWSDEDEERIKNTLSVLDVQVCWDGATGKKGNPYQKEIDWLKSIKERIIWKPSKKQMETLEYYMHTLLATEHKEVLFGLYNDLKKL